VSVTTDVAERLMKLMQLQEGIISRRQLLELGINDVEIERRLRRRDWARVHPGVYVEHTGPPTPKQRAWGAMLYYSPAALAADSALAIAKVRGYVIGQTSPIEIAVDRDRRVIRRVGITVRQHTRFETLCHMQLDLPRQRLEHAGLDVASRLPVDGGVGVLSDLVQQGRTTPKRLLDAVHQRPRLRQRALFIDVLGDVQSGAHSVLEQRYLNRVERAHGLPTANRQRRVRNAGSVTYRDVDYVDFLSTIELDGTLGHSEVTDQWADLERDVFTIVGGGVTLRAGWVHVLDECRLALAVARLLAGRGWTEWIKPCSLDCGAFPAPGAENAPQIA